MRRYVPWAIADLIEANPEAAEASLGALEKLLTHEDEKVRLAAASSLASQRVGQDERVAELLRNAVSSPDKLVNRLGVEALAKAGSRAIALVPSLLELLERTDEKYLRTDTLRALGKIQPELAATMPEVAQVLSNDAQARALEGKVIGEAATYDELLAAVRIPQTTFKAALRLGEMGAAAQGAIPSILQSLSGWDDEHRDRMVEAIHKIDPNFVVQRVEEKAITEAMIAARIALGARQDSVHDFVMQNAAMQTWWTRDEVLVFAQQLAAKDHHVHAAFVDRLIERDPTLSDALGKQIK